VGPGLYVDPVERADLKPGMRSWMLLNDAGMKRIGPTPAQYDTVFRLAESGFIIVSNWAPRLWVLDMNSWEAHLDRTAEDPGPRVRINPCGGGGRDGIRPARAVAGERTCFPDCTAWTAIWRGGPVCRWSGRCGGIRFGVGVGNHLCMGRSLCASAYPLDVVAAMGAVCVGGLISPRVLGVGYETIQLLLRGEWLGASAVVLLLIKAWFGVWRSARAPRVASWRHYSSWAAHSGPCSVSGFPSATQACGRSSVWRAP